MNKLKVYNPKPEKVNTVYPITVTDEKGNKKLIHVAMSDEEFQELQVDDFKLSALLRAGIDPNSMHVNTSSHNSATDILNFDNVVQDFISNSPVTSDNDEN